MAELRYEAYISYSHEDEAWAKWLHRELESYRVPRKLVGKKTSVGEIPAKIRPVFRDRDDLASATDLDEAFKQSLADSENLIVVCSPSAAASHWVSEEIHLFANLGRADRIFCIIVDGEPAADGSVAACFSPALAEVGHPEPMAADVRKWADGKHIAKLKLIAGLLGLRLDELIQRDLQRRRKHQVVGGLGIVAALTLTVMTVVSQISEQQERDKAEQLAISIVDLGERVQSDASLETRAMIGALASEHFASLNPDKLSPESAKKVALAIRQVGLVAQGQGKPDEALEAFQRSRDLLSTLVKKYPEMPRLLFQLGNAEFYIGNLHNEQGHYDQALEAMQNYHHLTRTLFDTDPENLEWIIELSYSHNNLAAVRLDSGIGFDEETQFHLTEAIKLMESVVAVKPNDGAIADSYATILAWAADAQNQACNLAESLILRNKVRGLTESATLADTANNDLKRRHAYAISGVARAEIATGRLDLAEQDLGFSISILQQLSVIDPSNVLNREQALFRQSLLARLLGDTGQLGLALPLMNELESRFEAHSALVNQSAPNQGEYIDFLLAYADVEYQLGDIKTANKRLQSVIQLKLSNPDLQSGDIFYIQRLVKTRYQWWRLNGTDNLDHLAPIPEFDQTSTSGFRSCTEADSAARIYIIENDKDKAAKEVEYLMSKGYADPNFIRFCVTHDLCEA